MGPTGIVSMNYWWYLVVEYSNIGCDISLYTGYSYGCEKCEVNILWISSSTYGWIDPNRTGKYIIPKPLAKILTSQANQHWSRFSKKHEINPRL